jgi:probable F420-dependent oxidoreductase
VDPRGRGAPSARGGARVKIGIALSRLNPAFHLEATTLAEQLGYESVWMADHLAFPVDMSGSPHPGEDLPPVPPSTPVYDTFGWLCFLAGRTSRIRLGTNVYLLGLRHPFTAARAVQTLDIVSQGRVELGVGAGWLRQEWRAAGLDPATRGRRLDEALAVCERLWTEEVVEHHGEFFDFAPVMFEPKPVQKPRPRIHVGGESEAALRRAARYEGWYALAHTAASAAARVARLRELRRELGRESLPFEVTVSGGEESPEEIEALAAAGVDRLVVAPWRRSRECAEGLRRYAGRIKLAPA